MRWEKTRLGEPRKAKASFHLSTFNAKAINAVLLERAFSILLQSALFELAFFPKRLIGLWALGGEGGESKCAHSITKAPTAPSDTHFFLFFFLYNQRD